MRDRKQEIQEIRYPAWCRPCSCYPFFPIPTFCCEQHGNVMEIRIYPRDPEPAVFIYSFIQPGSTGNPSINIFFHWKIQPLPN